MSLYEIQNRIRSEYVSHSPDTARYRRDTEPLPLDNFSSYRVIEPDYRESEGLRQDAATLAELLRPVELPQYASLADQVFGNQVHQQRLSLQHTANLLRERTKLHNHILKDIEHRHIQVQEQMFGADLHANLDNHGREMKLERLLITLDEQRRQEELDFWKDTATLRDAMFEAGKEYQAMRHRTSLLQDIEPGGQADV